MLRVCAILVLAATISASAAAQTTHPDLSGQWTLESATIAGNSGTAQEKPAPYIVSTGLAFNCGRECRISSKGASLVIESAKFDAATAPAPTVSIITDGQMHSVADSVDVGKPIDVTARWENGKLLVSSQFVGRPVVQTLSIDKGQLVVTSMLTTTLKTLRYTKK